MRRRTRLAAAVSAAALTVSGLGLLAPAAHAADTTVTFTISGGALSISAPATGSLGTVNASSLLGTGGTLGPTAFSATNTVVTDQRAVTPAAWTVGFSSTSFTTGSASTAETVANSSVTYLSGTGTVTGTGAFTPGTQKGDGSLPVLGEPKFVGIGANSVSINPTLTLQLAANQVAGTYTGTITQSVS
jgi:hypothetical protein